MVKTRIHIPKLWHGISLALSLAAPLAMNAETFNMPNYGHVDKTVAEPLEFYDPKGTEKMSGSSASAYSTVVFKPANPGEAVQISFSKIALESDGANYPVSLSIWDGTYDDSGISYPSVYTNVPVDDFPESGGTLLKRYATNVKKEVVSDENVTFTSSAADGSLSITFQWKYANPSEGWVATVNSVTLTDQELLSITTDYSAVNANPYPGLKDVTLGSINVKTTGILNPFTANTLSFTLDDNGAALENVRLLAAGKAVDAEPEITGNTYTYNINRTLTSGDNTFTVKADVKADAPFYSTAALTFTSLTTSAPETPAITAAEPVTVTVAAVVMMPADGSHSVCTVEEGKSVLFYDNGGPAAAYPENTSGIVTFKPAEGAEGKVMLDFTSIQLFNTNPSKNDVLIVYNGSEVNPDNILVTLLKQTKALVRSTAPDGALTVSFSTTTGVPKAGWEATASLFVPTAMTLVGTDVSSASDQTVAAGDTDCPLLKLLVKTKDTEPAMTLSGITLDFSGTDTQWDKAKVYNSGNRESFDITSATLLGEGNVTAGQLALSFAEPATLLEGDNFIWVLADVKADAQSGTKVNALIQTVTLNGEAIAVSAPASEIGREVYNLIYPAKDHPVKTVYNSMNVANKPYSSTYTGYDGTKDDLLVTFIPAHEGNVCEIDFSKLNLYFYESQWSPSSNVTPVFKIFAGTTADGPILYSHTKANNVEAGADASAIGTIRSTAADGALTILFNAGATGSSNTKYSDYGFLGEVREYLSRPMSVENAEAFTSGLTTVAVATATNVPMIGVKVTAEGNLNPVSLDQLSFELKADPTIYTALKLATSGKKADHTGATVIATAEVADGVVSFTPASALAEGVNTFWLLADVSPQAAPGSVIDAKVSLLTISGTTMEVANADPEGEILTVNTYDPILGDTEQVVEVGQYPVIINGVTAAYMSNNYTITAKPAMAGGKVTAKFTEGAFNVNTSNQYITVLGGAEPLGVDAETVYPVSVTSTREDGSLTIEYHSMTIAKEEGWKCELSCEYRLPFIMDGFQSIPAGNDKSTAGSEALLYGLKFDVTGDKDEITLSSFGFDIPSAADIFSELRLYATGHDAEFLRNNLIATLTLPSAEDNADNTSAGISLVPTEPYIISEAGSYHFWLQGVVKADAENALTTTIKPTVLSYSAAGADGSADLSTLDTSSFKVIGGFHGTYRIGSSAEARYANFTDALLDVETGIDGPVTFIVEPGTYNERVELDHIPGVSATNTITFTGESGDPTDVVLVWNKWEEPPYSDDKLEHYYGVLTLRGTSNVSLSGMTIRTTNLDMPSVVHIANGASDITIDGCIISAPTSNTTYNNLTLLNSYVSPSATAMNNNLTVLATDFVGGYAAIKYGSATINQPESEGITVNSCSFSNQGYQAIYLYFAKDVDITGNLLSGTVGDKNYAQMIDLNISGPATIERNVLKYQKTGVYGMYFRRLEGSDEAPVIIANNIIDVDALAQAGAGVQFYNSNSKPFSGFLFAHNTIRTNGDIAVMPLIINIKTGTQFDGRIANNIFQNAAGSYVIKEQYGPSGATYLNNVGYTSNPDFGYAYWGGSYDQEMTFNQWVINSGETGAVNADIQFSTAEDSNPLYPVEFGNLKGGTPLTEVPTDILGNTRSLTAPTAGAYEAATSGIDDIDATNGIDALSSAEGGSIFATDHLSVDAGDADIRIYSLSGALLMSTHVNGPAIIDVDSLPRGLCILTTGDRAVRLFLR